MGVGVEEVILEEMEEEHAAEIGMSTEISNNFYIWYIYYFHLFFLITILILIKNFKLCINYIF